MISRDLAVLALTDHTAGGRSCERIEPDEPGANVAKAALCSHVKQHTTSVAIGNALGAAVPHIVNDTIQRTTSRCKVIPDDRFA